ncbi:uncharacterized protein BO80DRAFT_92024 [Aspergillus ibericus CBS 121593]|uniref:Uncharacterized protein n=1 Tax=Aspergillus ibericus CBS 121593 TaxID=1448316 RepID=A0A395H0W3_9EURO|nr:hypothetical protein BO80DRAFT_92024 [Aspergillus ibericus CBS 121593]RAL00568.1 hypothetical protein BO80DRAFT_92024 [Aspergillus ibericus CBS 121593]
MVWPYPPALIFRLRLKSRRGKMGNPIPRSWFDSLHLGTIIVLRRQPVLMLPVMDWCHHTRTSSFLWSVRPLPSVLIQRLPFPRKSGAIIADPLLMDCRSGASFRGRPWVDTPLPRLCHRGWETHVIDDAIIRDPTHVRNLEQPPCLIFPPGRYT